MTDISNPKDRLANIARMLRNSEPVQAVTVREFLRWFYETQRRGRWIVTVIRNELQVAGLRTVPDFESTYLDAEMKFELVTAQPLTGIEIQPLTGALGIETRDSVTLGVTEHATVRIVSSTFADPTYRISKLAAANRKPVFVRPDSSITEAVTLMMANDFSQLPVMTSDRDVKGSVSWKSIGSRLALGKTPQLASDAMEPHAEISSDDSIFKAIPIIVEHEYVLVRGADRQISGIITTNDLSLQFLQLSEPFLLLGEIENHIRKIIDTRYGPGDLVSAKDPADGARAVEKASDLTFGEYKRLLEEPSRWARLNLQLDRAVFVKRLDRVREIRNDVMHFDPDGIEDKALEELRDFAKFLLTLQTIGAT